MVVDLLLPLGQEAIKSAVYGLVVVAPRLFKVQDLYEGRPVIALAI